MRVIRFTARIIPPSPECSVGSPQPEKVIQSTLPPFRNAAPTCLTTSAAGT